MTAKDLKALRTLDQEIALTTARIEKMQAHPSVPVSPELKEKSLRELKLLRYIQVITDDELRLIFAYRYLEGLSWEKIARQMGYQDESAPRKRHGRYLRGLQKRGRRHEAAGSVM